MSHRTTLDLTAFKKKYANKRKNADWEFCVNSYARNLRMLEIVQSNMRVFGSHEKGIKARLEQLEKQFPQLKKLFFA